MIDFASIPKDNFKQEFLHYIFFHVVKIAVMVVSEAIIHLLLIFGKMKEFLVVVYMGIPTHANHISYHHVKTICINAQIMKIPPPVKINA